MTLRTPRAGAARQAHTTQVSYAPAAGPFTHIAGHGFGRDVTTGPSTVAQLAIESVTGRSVRVHRTCVVNLAKVQHVEPYFHGDVVIHLANGTKVISGRTYRAEVRAAFGLSRHTD